MEIERGLAGALPYAATGSGPPVVVLAGLWPTTGVESKQLVSGALGPLRRLRGSRRLVVFNRRSQLPTGMTMDELAVECADAIRAEFGPPVDVVGASTGGSIAQQLAADHPEMVRRLVLVSTACRLGLIGREVQSQVATRLRADRVRSAVSLVAANLAPRGLRTLTRGVGWLAARHVLRDATAAADLATTLEAEDGFDLARCAGSISAKTLIVAGGRDRFYGSDLFRATAALIPESQLLLRPRRGHITVAGDARVQATIAGFLS